MKLKKFNICKFSLFLSISLIIYISISSYIDYIYFNNETLEENILIIKIVSLLVLILIISFLFIFFKFYKSAYLEKQIKQRTENIIHENETLKIYSHIDTLTQCLNKKSFMERLDEEFKRAIRDKQELSLLIVNIDEFKSFNDIYGRNEGDECLKIVANILINHCNRPSDIVARYKNDEFYILLPNTKNPSILGEKCIKSVNSLQIPHENSIASNILTISIGTNSLLPKDISEKDAFIEKAKDYLLKAKKSGRNRIF